jgi:hypothetical protein
LGDKVVAPSAWARFCVMGSVKRSPVPLAVLALIFAALACGAPSTAIPPAPSITTAPLTTSTPLATSTPTDTWLRVTGDTKADQSWAVVTDDQANLYWGTFQQPPGELFTDMVIYKFNPNGDQLWETRYGDEFQEKLFILAVSPPYLLVGGEQDHSLNINQADMIVLALDLEDGKLVWEYTYDQGFGYEEVDGLVVDGDDIYVSGWTTSEKTGNDVGLLKLDHQGSLIWANAWGGADWDQADGQMVIDDEYIYVTGRYGGTGFLVGGQGLLAQFRKDTGEYVQNVVWGEDQFYDGYGMTSDGTYLYVVGLTIVPRPGLAGNGQIFVQKWDKNFHLLWEQQWGGSGGDQARAIGVDDAGRIIVAGNTMLGTDRQIVLLVYDGQGSLLTETIWGGAQEEAAHGLWIDGEYVYLAGETRTLGAGMNDALLLRLHIPSTSH